MDQDNSHNDVLIYKDGALGRITLNRPKALNALNLDMIRGITFALDTWAHDDSIKAVFIDGAGDRAFCAGGDIKSFYSIGMDYRRGKIGFDVAMLFFNEEYDLNEKIFNYSKPVISFMHGITMGGGFGIAGHAKYKIIAENSVFAMPETRIGFFPDIGSMYHLTRMPHNIGLFLAVTGATINADDMHFCGIGQYSATLPKKDIILDQIQVAFKDSNNQEQSLEAVLEPYRCKSNSIGHIGKMSADIEHIFSEDDLSRSIEILCDKYDEFNGLNKACSPLSMAIAGEYYRHSVGKDFSEIIKTDKLICKNYIIRSEFYEGIRAALIDKDKMPKWEYDDVSMIPNELISSYFN